MRGFLSKMGIFDMTPEREAKIKKLEEDLEEIERLEEAGNFREILTKKYVSNEEFFDYIDCLDDEEIEETHNQFKTQPEYQNVKRFFEGWETLPRERKEVALYEFYKQDFK